MTLKKILSRKKAVSNAVAGHRRGLRFQMAGLAILLCAAAALSQNTQVTIEGTITSVGSVSGIAVGDKYVMVVYYNPAQAPASTVGSGEAYYTAYTLNAVVEDKNGNQTFTADTDEELFVQDVGGDQFISPPCCSATGAGFALTGTSSAFTSYALPTALTLSDFNLDNYTAFGSGALGNITSIKVVNTAGVMPAFITAGYPDPNGKVPTANGVPGSGINNLDIGFPQTGLIHGNAYIYTIALQVINFTGTCKTSVALTQVQNGKTVTVDSASDRSFSCSPGQIFYWVFDGHTLPNSPGPATLTGTVTYGTSKATTSTTVVLQ